MIAMRKRLKRGWDLRLRDTEPEFSTYLLKADTRNVEGYAETFAEWRIGHRGTELR
jgi:hypothetical protein